MTVQRDISELARTFQNLVNESAQAHMPTLVPLEVFDASMHQETGWALCYLADRVVRCIVDPLYDLSEAVNSTNYVLWALPAKGSDDGGEYVAIAHAMNGPAGTRTPAIRATSVTIVDSGGSSTPVSTVTDHGGLTGLSDDDHSQYHNDARGDARYYTESELNAGQLDTRYYTESEVDTALAAQDDASEITFTPNDNTDWTGSADPGDTNDALDQLASRTTTLEGSSGSGDTTLAFIAMGV